MTHPKPPKHLSSESKRLWKAIHTDYEMDDPARMILTTTLEARDQHEAARAALAVEGCVQVDRFGQKKPHPMVGIQATAAVAMQRGFRLLGFDQEARAEKGR